MFILQMSQVPCTGYGDIKIGYKVKWFTLLSILSVPASILNPETGYPNNLMFLLSLFQQAITASFQILYK